MQNWYCNIRFKDYLGNLLEIIYITIPHSVNEIGGKNLWTGE
jgi:hypothetical protein